MELIAGKNCKYRGRTIPAGERFTAPRQFARVLLALKCAKRAPTLTAAAPKRKARTYSTRVIAQTETAVVTADGPEIATENSAGDAESESKAEESPPEQSAATSEEPGKPEAETSAVPEVEDLKALRSKFRAKFGRPPHHTWNEAKIREKLAAE